MKALTLTQPWATLVINGDKWTETRSWRTAYRGTLAIHAAKNWTHDDRDFAWNLYKRGFLSADVAHGIKPTDSPDHLPLGMVLGTVELLDCLPTDDMSVSFLQREFGDFSPGRYAWVLSEPKRFDEPVPARGALSIWEWEPAA